MSLPQAKYYIENHATHTSITRGTSVGQIVARIYTDLKTQMVRRALDSGGLSFCAIMCFDR